jgi:SAM-dependent methyltransferase
VQTESIERCAVCLSTDIAELDPANALSTCKSCGFVFDSPRPTIDELVAFYSRPGQYEDWIEAQAARDEVWRRRVAKMLPYSQPGSLLDIGTGIGQFLVHARHHFDYVTGTEISTSAVDIARARYGLEILQGQVEQMQIDRRFDNVTMFHVLEHVPDPSRTIARCVELLQPGGALVIAVPNDLEAARQRVKRRLAKAGVPRYARGGPMALPRISLDGTMTEIHLSHFTVSSLRRLLERHGLAVVDHGLDPYSVAQDMRGVMDTLLRYSGEIALRVTGRNLYDAIWMVARKPA